MSAKQDPYADVWPSTKIGEDETKNFREQGEVIIAYSVEVGDIIHMAEECNVSEESLRLSVVGAVGGLAVRVTV
jgi:hypothetical protein